MGEGCFVDYDLYPSFNFFFFIAELFFCPKIIMINVWYHSEPLSLSQFYNLLFSLNTL